ncbi:MAG: hypothetical protein PHU42_04570 [Patescibacteria group bacterium]|nr:hypothetical protein [Patescibacteria group bacterium]
MKINQLILIKAKQKVEAEKILEKRRGSVLKNNATFRLLSHSQGLITFSHSQECQNIISKAKGRKIN